MTHQTKPKNNKNEKIRCLLPCIHRQAGTAFSEVWGSIIREYVEVESYKRNDRPQLQDAIAYAMQKVASLVVAKLDRLSPNAGFIFALRNSWVEFV